MTGFNVSVLRLQNKVEVSSSVGRQQNEERTQASTLKPVMVSGLNASAPFQPDVSRSPTDASDSGKAASCSPEDDG